MFRRLPGLLVLLILASRLAWCESSDESVVSEMLKIGEVYETNKCYKGAIGFYERVLKKHPDTTLAPLIKFRIGNCFSELGDYSEALSIYREIEKEYPNSEYAPQACLKEGDILAKLRRYDESLQVFEKFIKDYPNDEKLAYAFYMKAKVLREKWLRSELKHLLRVDKDMERKVVEAYKTYIKKFPQDEFVEQAFNDLEDTISALEDALFAKSLISSELYGRLLSYICRKLRK
jgi:outer membrane protein assembly factor BamD (BamD/ComL family)